MIPISDLFVLCKKSIRHQPESSSDEPYNKIVAVMGGEDGAPVTRGAESKKKNEERCDDWMSEAGRLLNIM
jgi:hypothetical protein